ncbi:MAG TPA: Hpt domain-containing protein [Casimicrobiaceae bacterium]|jgi:HPt (histidine-containing phosphotransfer) domain-containing protein|nr:Hpt domain-containing protein [Casimicrobiaceae bacterium]
MSAPTIDRATFEALKQTTGADFALELVDTFLQEAPVMLEDLRRALAAKDAEKFRRTAHSLKSNSNTFGALTLAAMARELELTSAAKVSEGRTEPVDALAQEYSRVAAALTALRHA